MYLLVVFLALVNFFIIFLFSNFIGKQGVLYFSITVSLVNWFIAAFILFEVMAGQPCWVTLCTWFELGTIVFSWAFFFDYTSTLMVFIICYISTIVILFSNSYMYHDPHYPRFMSFLFLFTFFMLLFVVSDNIIILFLGWEGVGFCSFLLINFWYTRMQASRAAIKAIIVNRFGDISLLFFISLIFFYLGTFDIHLINCLIFLFSNCYIDFFFLLLI